MSTANVAQYVIDIDGTKYAVRRWRGTESVSKPFRYTVVFESEDLSLSLDSFVGKTVQVAVMWKSGGPSGSEQSRGLYGVVIRASQSGMSEVRGKEARAIYQVEVVPRLWSLTLRTNCRIFQDKKTDDIVLAILKEHGIKGADVRKNLRGTCRQRGYCVQYRETDFDFISRLLEEDGIAYYFEFKNNKDVIVLANYAQAHSACEPESEIQFHRNTLADIDRQFVYKCDYSTQMVSGTSTLDDFDFVKPKTDLKAEKKGQQFTHLELYDYPGDYEEKSDGDQQAKVRLEEAGREEKVLRGESNCYWLCAGFAVTMKDHFSSDVNQEYLILSVEHEADQSGAMDSVGGVGYSNVFTAIPKSTPFRPPRLVPRPVVQGPQTAVVVGTSGEEIYVDEYGRVKVQFHWDREGKYDEKSSCWVRVSHAWAGGQWGAIYTPRVGQEVIVDFLEGDPDRPIITGRVYNKETMPPYSLPSEKTKSTIRSKTYKGTGSNELRFEDKTDKEQILLYAQKDQDNRVNNDSKEWIGNERHLIIEVDQFEKTKGDKHLSVSGDHNEKIGGSMSLHVSSDQKVKIGSGQDLTVGADQKEKVGSSKHLTVGMDFKEKVGMNKHVQAGMNYNIKAGMKLSEQAGMDVHVKAGMNFAVQSGLAMHLKAGLSSVVEAGLSLTLKAGSGYVAIGPTGVMISGPMVLINSGGAAGAGTGSQPVSPAAPSSPGSPTAPQDPKEADTTEHGSDITYTANAITFQTADGLTFSFAAPTSRTVPASPASQVLAKAAKDGTPYCEECEKAAGQGQGSQPA